MSHPDEKIQKEITFRRIFKSFLLFFPKLPDVLLRSSGSFFGQFESLMPSEPLIFLHKKRIYTKYIPFKLNIHTENFLFEENLQIKISVKACNIYQSESRIHKKIVIQPCPLPVFSINAVFSHCQPTPAFQNHALPAAGP